MRVVLGIQGSRIRFCVSWYWLLRLVERARLDLGGGKLLLCLSYAHFIPPFYNSIPNFLILRQEYGTKNRIDLMGMLHHRLRHPHAPNHRHPSPLWGRYGTEPLSRDILGLDVVLLDF